MNAPATNTEWRAKSANQTRLAFGQALLEIGAREAKAVVVSADTQDLLGIRGFIERFRERFVELGIAEQNVIGAAAGLATTGLHPYVCAYAPFITARSMEQVRNDIAYARRAISLFWHAKYNRELTQLTVKFQIAFCCKYCLGKKNQQPGCQ